jgi:hypothetical protein
MSYSDEQINDFLELAQEIGITRAKRELGYPKSWGTAQRWAELRGVTVAVDEIKAVAAAVREAYKDEDVMVVVTEGFNRVYEEITTNEDLTPDDQKKLSEAANKYYNMYASIKGKATSITETRQTDTMDQHLEELLNAERAKNILRKEDVTDQ